MMLLFVSWCRRCSNTTNNCRHGYIFWFLSNGGYRFILPVLVCTSFLGIVLFWRCWRRTKIKNHRCRKFVISFFWKLIFLFVRDCCDTLSFWSIPPGVLHLSSVVASSSSLFVNGWLDNDKATEVQTNFVPSHNYSTVVKFRNKMLP